MKKARPLTVVRFKGSPGRRWVVQVPRIEIHDDTFMGEFKKLMGKKGGSGGQDSKKTNSGFCITPSLIFPTASLGVVRY